ncbi:hypothetical protein IAT40_000027 [Kwoniella sp. CBS 6097]
MSNKPTYAAIVHNNSSSGGGGGVKSDSSAAVGATSGFGSGSGGGVGPGSGAGPSDAPPPYSAPTHPAQPHQTILPPPTPQQQQHRVSYYRHGHADEAALVSGQGWVQPPANVAKSRALRRFWVAFFWAWVIWVLVGLLIGGGISDVNGAPPHRHGHWDKHGDWHGDSVNDGVNQGVYLPTILQAKEKVVGGLLPDFASS